MTNGNQRSRNLHLDSVLIDHKTGGTGSCQKVMKAWQQRGGRKAIVMKTFLTSAFKATDPIQEENCEGMKDF